MRIVYLIGNGFDLAQGLKTTYNQFYKERILKASFPSGILNTLQNSIKEDVTSWADLEKRLGEFTTEMTGLEDVDTVYDYLKKELRDYLNEEESRIAVSPEKCLRNRSILLFPESKLPPESEGAIQAHIKNLTSSNKVCDIDVISFNYTSVFEKVIGYDGNPIAIGKRDDDINVKLNTIYKVHGALNREIIFGVADTEQIANKSLAQDMDATDVLVKTRTTAIRRDYVSKRCADLIKKADIIVMYGLSIGETDRNWWKLVTDRLQTNSSARLIIYGHLDDDSLLSDYPRISRKERALYKKLYTCNGATNIKFTRLDQQIYISLDSSIFKGITD